MSNPGGVDNLTPFEYALAGVDVPQTEGSPGLKVIGHMRSLMSEVEQTPVLHPDLTKLLSTGGLTGRAERRDQKRRTETKTVVADDGGFVDITPVELADANSADEEEPAEAGPAETEPLKTEPAETEPPETEPAETEPAEKMPALAQRSGPDKSEPDEVDRLIASLEAMEAEDLEARADSDEYQDRTVALHEVSAASFEAARLFEDELGEVPDALFPSDSAQFHDNSAQPKADSAQPKADSAQLQPDSAQLQADSAQFNAEPVLIGADHDEGTAAFVTGTVVGMQETTSEDADKHPMAVAAVTGVIPLKKKRLGTAFWAVTGTAAAAAALTIGGLWWANSLNTDNNDASAAAVLGSEEAPGSPQAGVATDDGSADGTASDDNSSTGSLTEDNSSSALDVPSADDDPSSSSTMTTTLGSDGSSTTSDPNTSGPGTAAPNTQATTTDPPTTQTTTTRPSTTTQPPTTQTTTTTAPPTTQTTTTQPPTTQTTTTTTTAPPTTQTPRFAVIGGSATVGSANGPGLEGARVRLYRDTNRDGVFEDLLQSTEADQSGRYRFATVDPACYAVNVSAPSSLVRIPSGQSSRELCVTEGQQTEDLSTVASVNPPDGCFVEGFDPSVAPAGVEVYENDQVLAEGYVFYGASNDFLTRKLGQPDDFDGPGDYEWFLSQEGFSHRDVFFVAAQQFGQVSGQVRCGRG